MPDLLDKPLEIVYTLIIKPDTRKEEHAMKTQILTTPTGSILYAIDPSDTAHALAVILDAPQRNNWDTKPGNYSTPLGRLPDFTEEVKLFTRGKRSKPLTEREAKPLITRILAHDRILFSTNPS